MDTTRNMSSTDLRYAAGAPEECATCASVIANAATPGSPGDAVGSAFDDLALRFSDIGLSPKQLGALGERYAAAWLERRGCTILDRNWRSRYGELDVIAMTPERVILFVEVKTRRTARYGTPQEAVTARKRLALRRAGVQWLLQPERRVAHRGVRFDVIAITAPPDGLPSVNHIREAF